MPIILLWNNAAAPFEAQFSRWLAEIARSTFLLGRWIKLRLAEAERLDRFSASFKVFRFYNMALTARVEDAQFGGLLTAPVAGVGAHVERALDQWNVARDVRSQARSAELPSEMLRVLEEMSAGILASIRRFERPTPEMFDPRRRTASDLFGLAALAFRTVGGNRAGLRAAAERIHRDLGLPSPRPETAASTGRRAPPELPFEATLEPIGRQFEEINRSVAGALMVIPALSALVGRIGGDTLVAARYRLLAGFESIEALAHSWRRRLFIGLRDGVGTFAEASLQLLARIAGLATGHIRAFTGIGVALLRGVMNGVGAYAGQLQVYWRSVTDLIGRIASFGTAVVNIDLGEVIHLSLVTVQDAIEYIGFTFYPLLDDPEEYDAPPQFPVTVGDLVLHEGNGERANRELRTAIARLSSAIAGAGGVLNIFVERYAGARLRALMQLGAALFGRSPAPPVAQPILTVDTGGAPDLVANFVHPLRLGLSRAVAGVGTASSTAVAGIFGAAGTALNQTASSFSDAANAAVAADPRTMQRLGGNTDLLVRVMLGDQPSSARPTGFEPAAGAFESWVAERRNVLTAEGWVMRSGFDTVAAAASGYLRFLLDEWLLHVAENRDTAVAVTPTSPKRLLERAELGEVRLPELRIVARGRALGRPLAQRLAGEFQAAVQGAYAAGRARLGQYAAAAR